MDPNIVQDFVYPEDGVHIDGQKYPILCRKLSDMRSSEQRLELTPAQSLQCLYEAVEYLSLEVEALDLQNKNVFIVIGASRTGKGTLLAAL